MKGTGFLLSFNNVLLLVVILLDSFSLFSESSELDDRKRIKFGPIRSPFVTDLENNHNNNEEEEEVEEENDDFKRSRTNVLYFLISSFANASDNLKTLIKFLLTSNQLILAGWIIFIISIFVLSYLITINPIGTHVHSPSLKEEEEETEEITEQVDGKRASILTLDSSSEYSSIYSKNVVQDEEPIESTLHRLQVSLKRIFESRGFRERLDAALLECIQGNVQILEEDYEVKIFQELSIDYEMPEQNMVISARAQDFQRQFLFENNKFWNLKDIKFLIESRNEFPMVYVFKIPFDGNEMVFESECQNLVQSYFVSLDISDEMEMFAFAPYRQKSSQVRSNEDSLSIDILKLTGAESDALHISLSIDEPSSQSLYTQASPYRNLSSDLIWNTQFAFAINPDKSKKLLMEVIEEKEGRRILGSANISISDLHLIPSQKHTIPILDPSNSSPTHCFLSVQLFYHSSDSKWLQIAQKGGFYVHKILDSTFVANQLTSKTSYQLRGAPSTTSVEPLEEKNSSLVANAALNNLLGVENRSSGSLPYRSTMHITSVQKLMSNQFTEVSQSIPSHPIPSQHDPMLVTPSEVNGYHEEQKSDLDEDSGETEMSIESVPMSPNQSQQVKINTVTKNNITNLFVIPSPVKKSKENFIASLKRIISGPSLYSLDINSPRPRGRLYSSPSRFGKKSFISSSSLSLKSLNRGALNSRLNIRSNQVHHSSDIGYSSNSDSEFSLEFKSDWKGPRSLSWESWDSGASYLLLPGEGDGSSMSDVSGVSGASFATGNNGNAVKKAGRSLLVFETLEYGLLRHYLIPHKKGGTRLGKRQGSKLHVFNNHLFIAKHIKRGTYCSVCRKRIILRLGKQGYVCRDCGKICHKQCHEKVEDICMKSSFPEMELFRGSTIMKKKDK